MERSILPEHSEVVAKIAQRALAARATDHAAEVRRLLEAGREVMHRNGTTARAKVADIVAAAGLSNDAFYRYFPSKDALVAAILEDGTERLRSYLAHQMGKETTAEGAVTRWIEGVLSQAADEDSATTTLAVLWNAGSLADQPGVSSASATLASLLDDPIAALGSARPELDASIVAHAVVGRLSELLWHRRRPEPDEVRHLVAFCLRAVTPPA